jgi:hypothetical protein
VGDEFEVRTEAVIGGERYRAHPNYRGGGPSFDFVKVKFNEFDPPLSSLFYPQDNLVYPAKLVGFFRLLTPEDNPDLAADDYFVLAHCAEFQELGSEVYDRRTLLTRSWLYEATPSNKPKYSIAGSVKVPDLKGHVYAFDERPGYHETYRTEEDKRFIVLSDMRKDWPNVFVGKPV